MRKVTRYIKIHPLHPQKKYIRFAARVLLAGGTVAFPTETVYGLGANALDGAAVEKIFLARRRPGDNPLIVHVARREELDRLVTRVPAQAERLIDLFWPGPLTLILPRSWAVPDQVTAGLDTVAVRMPRHPVALALIRAAGVPVAAPSANLSGKPSPTSGLHVLRDLAGRVNLVLDGGRAEVGLESTVLDLTGDCPLILRPGGVSREELEQVLGQVALDPALAQDHSGLLKPRSPGLKYTHYAPAARVFVIRAALPERLPEALVRLVRRARTRGKRVGLLLTAETAREFIRQKIQPDYLEVMGSRNRPQEIAARLFEALRNCDRHRLDLVYAESIPEKGIGLAVMNRLLKAAGYRVIRL